MISTTDFRVRDSLETFITGLQSKSYLILAILKIKYIARQIPTRSIFFLKAKKSDVFHVHNEHEFHLHSEEWIQKIKAKELEMIAWQQANLDTIIPGLLLHLI